MLGEIFKKFNAYFIIINASCCGIVKNKIIPMRGESFRSFVQNGNR